MGNILNFFLALAGGLVVGGVLLVIWFPLYVKIREASERRKIKKMVKKGQFLVTIDERDYDKEMWKEYINAEENKKILENLPKQLFAGKEEQQRSMIYGEMEKQEEKYG